MSMSATPENATRGSISLIAPDRIRVCEIHHQVVRETVLAEIGSTY
jgi:hypothetical protein